MDSQLRVLWPVVVAVGIAAEAIGVGYGDAGRWLPDLAAGWIVAACGLVAWQRRPASLAGPLLVATALLWFAGDVSGALVYAYRGPLVQLVLTYPTGRPRGRASAVAVVALYAIAAVEPVWGSSVATLVLSAALVLFALATRRSTRGRARREHAYALGASTALALLFAATAAARLASPTPVANHVSLHSFEIGLAALAAALLYGLLAEPWARIRASDLVVELAETRSGELRDQLARALGDPSLELVFPVGAAAYVDAAGRPRALPEPGSPRETTVLARNGSTVAVLIHDAALLRDASLRDALAEATDLGAANARLQAEVRAQIADLQASRRRLLAAADDERRRLEHRLETTAERRLIALLPELDAARRAGGGDPQRGERLGRAHTALEESIADLRRLAAGLHPRELATGGLPAALRALAERCPVPVELAIAPPGDMTIETERTAYFVCSEGLANVVKYADASRAHVTLSVAGRSLRVEVVDDGRGGADPAAGTGLRGLADRVEALGGALTVDSAPSRGTRLSARIPLK